MSFQNQAQIVSLQEYQDIKSVLEANVRSFIRHGDAQRRQAMHRVLNAVLSNHKRSSMSFRSFDVKRNGEYIIILPKKHMSKDVCPGCGQRLQYSNMTLIQVQEEGIASDLVAWGCRKCGEVFSRIEYTGGTDGGA